MDMQLGRLERVDLRTAWQTEDGDFTNWLAQEENLALLAETLGLELECEGTEQGVGPFRADILCKDTLTDAWVLIENQLERTDHGHLGQLLTYAAGLDAVTIVWIASRFMDEHQAALDWLNEITDERFSFFGLEVELWRIGDSAFAPKFNIVSKPNDWMKAVGRGSRSLQPTATTALQGEFWAGLMEVLRNSGGPVKPRKPLPQSYIDFSLGRYGFSLQATVNTKLNRVRVVVVLHAPEAKLHFMTLQQEKAQIERELGYPLQWLELPDKKQSRIAVVLEDADISITDDWPRLHQWLTTELVRFHKVFSPRVRKLEVAASASEDDETAAAE